MNQNEDFKTEFLKYLETDYSNDFDQCFYIDQKRPSANDSVAFDFFNSEKYKIIELKKFIINQGIRDKKKFLFFVITNFYNQLFILINSSHPSFKLKEFFFKYEHSKSLTIKGINPWISCFQILTLINNWTDSKIENLGTALQIFLNFNNYYFEIIKKKIQNNDHKVILEYTSSKYLSALPPRIFETLVHILDLNFQEGIKENEINISQNNIIERLKILKKLVSVNKKLFFAVGDIHGYSASLNCAALVLSEFKCSVYFLGDYIDRGPDSLGTVDLLINLQKKYPHWVMLKGNHEDSFTKFVEENSLEYISNLLGKKHSSTEYLRNKDRIPVHYQYLKKLPIFIELNNTILLHGGIKDPAISEINKHPPQDLLWTYGVHKYWNGKKIIRAHEVHTEPTEEFNSVALDTGLAFNGFLTVALIEDSDQKNILKAAIKINKQGNIINVVILNSD